MLQPFRDLVVELGRAQAIEQLSARRERETDYTEQEAQAHRNRIHRLLSRLSPGRPSALAAVAAASGEILTEPDEMARELR